MFDTFVVRPGDAHHTHTHHEHRAPTDESVRLLREMERAALEKVVQAVRVDNSPIDAVLHYQRDILNDRDQFRIVYRINGERRTVGYEHREGQTGDRREQIAMGLRDALAGDIANVLTAGMLKAAGKFNGF